MHESTPEQRFWSKMEQPVGDKCWNWTGAQFWCGYGAFSYKGKQWYSHRLAYALTYGPMAIGVQVLHHCDNRLCCNPTHLFLGDNLANVKDKVSKNRQSRGKRHGDAVRPKTPRGIKHPKHKLTENEVREIRANYVLYSAEFGSKALAEKYGVRFQSILAIVKRQTWVHI